jgi:hypothetical protein
MLAAHLPSELLAHYCHREVHRRVATGCLCHVWVPSWNVQHIATLHFDTSWNLCRHS